jgi:hypothetical protein
MNDEEVKALLEKIAREELLIDTLETKRSSDDFHEVAVWCVKNALQKAFRAGQESARPK